MGQGLRFNIFRTHLGGRIECQGGWSRAQSSNIFRTGLGGRIECQGGGSRARSSNTFRTGLRKHQDINGGSTGWVQLPGAQSPTDTDKTTVGFNIQTLKGDAEGRSGCGGRSRAQSLNISQTGLGRHPDQGAAKGDFSALEVCLGPKSYNNTQTNL